MSGWAALFIDSYEKMYPMFERLMPPSIKSYSMLEPGEV